MLYKNASLVEKNDNLFLNDDIILKFINYTRSKFHNVYVVFFHFISGWSLFSNNNNLDKKIISIIIIYNILKI